MADLKLSVLDVIPLRVGQTTADALVASREMARLADRLGYTRYWVAGHHNMTASVSSVALWLLGSSAYSARLAASMGLPYVFANHFNIPGMEQVVATYRENFVPSAQHPEPKTLVPVNAIVAPTEEEAQKRGLVQRLSFARMRTGGRIEPAPSVEDLEGYAWTAAELAAGRPGPPFTYIGTPEVVARELCDLARKVGADEVMVAPSGGTFAAESPTSGAGRSQTLELLAAQLLD